MQQNQNLSEILEEIVAHNEKQLAIVDGDQGQAENLHTFLFDEIAVFNPFYDETFRFEVDPVEYYGEEVIRPFATIYQTGK